eukprot:6190735-Pleurochrysis_carterae.AAC.4
MVRSVCPCNGSLKHLQNGPVQLCLVYGSGRIPVGDEWLEQSTPIPRHWALRAMLTSSTSVGRWNSKVSKQTECGPCMDMQSWLVVHRQDIFAMSCSLRVVQYVHFPLAVASRQVRATALLHHPQSLPVAAERCVNVILYVTGLAEQYLAGERRRRPLADRHTDSRGDGRSHVSQGGREVAGDDELRCAAMPAVSRRGCIARFKCIEACPIEYIHPNVDWAYAATTAQSPCFSLRLP